MAKTLMTYTWYLIVFSVCIDRGDGSWKKRARDNLEHDIELFEKISEKIEHDIAAFYDEYSDELLDKNKIEKTPHKYVQKIHRKLKIKRRDQHDETKRSHANNSRNVTIDIPNNLKDYVTKRLTQPEAVHISIKNQTKNNDSVNVSQWPKFDDLLLAMGKRYDWKNDRWIKIKEKLKSNMAKKDEDDNSIDFHVKHKFSYRTVKLKSVKNRRNVVIAVSAVR